MMRLLSLLFISFLFSCNSTIQSEREKKSFNLTETLVIDQIALVNQKWQSENNPAKQWAFWHPAAYHIGNLAAFEVTNNEGYLEYSEAWAEANKWMGAKSTNPDDWDFRYGETDKHVLFGDWQACFQVYIDLHSLKPADYKIARPLEVMSYQVKTEEKEYWWWIDGLFMVMPVMPRMFELTGDSIYLEKLHEYYSYTKSIMYDQESGLWYRDSKYIYPGHTTNQGKKDFWSRGNGWVIAAHARTLDRLPATAPFREEYLTVFRKMAKSLKDAQQPQGYWTRSLLDPKQAPGPETSGTAFFAYGILWGVNNGILDKNEYASTIENAWEYISNTAIQTDGTLGYVQPIGEKAQPEQVLDQRSTSDFGVGAFLLAASEMIEYLEN